MWVHVALAWQDGFTGIVPQDGRRRFIPTHSETGVDLGILSPWRIDTRPVVVIDFKPLPERPTLMQ